MRILFASIMFAYPSDNGLKKTDVDLLEHLIGSGHEVVYLFPAIAEGNRNTLQKRFGNRLILVPSQLNGRQRVLSSARARISAKFSAMLNSYLSPADLVNQAATCECLIFDYWVVMRDFLKGRPDFKKPTILKANDIMWPRVRTNNPLIAAHVAVMRTVYRHWEVQAAQAADIVSLLSLDEARWLEKKGISTLHIPVTCDMSIFKPRASVSKLPETALFVGSQNQPNTGALHWLVDNVIPRVRERLPNFMLHVLWKNPSTDVLSLFERHSFLKRHDWVDDLAPFYNRFSIALSPFFNATGAKIKLIEAMASGCAVVSTPDGATGTAVRGDIDLLIADDSERFANHIVMLLREKSLCEKYGKAARAFAKEHHDCAHAYGPLDKWLASISRK